ncbi:MAG: flagellar basal body-associated FliL family protein [Alphaproteobacteria bacterium]|nr:flagellar basal body-associated FliL family protein [Alphaproteobacteria bacterium]
MKRVDIKWKDQFADKRIMAFVFVYLSILSAMGTLAFSYGTEQLKRHPLAGRSESAVYYDLSGVKTNISSVVAKMGAVKMELSIAVESKDAEKLEGYLPRIIDRIQTCLSHTTVEEISSNHSLDFMKKYILKEVNKVSGPVKIQDLYFRKLITV